jgi:glycosyltransferase 2 family protein
MRRRSSDGPPATRAGRRRGWHAAAWLVAGLGLATWLVCNAGAPAVGEALRRAGWRGLAAVSAFHLIATALMGLAWAGQRRSSRRSIFLWARLVRDAGSEVLPLSQIGGSVLGARVLIACGVTRTVATATTVVDATLEFLAQIAYAVLGLVLLIRLMPSSALVAPLAIGLPLAIVAALGLVVVQRHGSDGLSRLARRWGSAVSSGGPAVQAEIREIHRSTGILFRSFLLHFAAWMFTAAEAWLSLRFIGVSLDAAALLTIESLLYATRAVTFTVPTALGVQEGAYVLLGAAFGLSPDVALGLSLLKRGRDLVLGIPALLSWQIFESLRSRNGRSSRPELMAASAAAGRHERRGP